MSKGIVCILKGVLLVVVLLKLSILFDAPPKDFLLLYTMETCETETEEVEEDGGEEDEFIRIAIQLSDLHLVSQARHGYPSAANEEAHIREIVPPPPQG